MASHRLGWVLVEGHAHTVDHHSDVWSTPYDPRSRWGDGQFSCFAETMGSHPFPFAYAPGSIRSPPQALKNSQSNPSGLALATSGMTMVTTSIISQGLLAGLGMTHTHVHTHTHTDAHTHAHTHARHDEQHSFCTTIAWLTHAGPQQEKDIRVLRACCREPGRRWLYGWAVRRAALLRYARAAERVRWCR